MCINSLFRSRHRSIIAKSNLTIFPWSVLNKNLFRMTSKLSLDKTSDENVHWSTTLTRLMAFLTSMATLRFKRFILMRVSTGTYLKILSFKSEPNSSKVKADDMVNQLGWWLFKRCCGFCRLMPRSRVPAFVDYITLRTHNAIVLYVLYWARNEVTSEALILHFATQSKVFSSVTTVTILTKFGTLIMPTHGKVFKKENWRSELPRRNNHLETISPIVFLRQKSRA